MLSVSITPPGAVLSVSIKDKDKDKTLPKFFALIDTGSDSTYMPWHLVGPLENSGFDYNVKKFKNFDGEKKAIYALDISNATIDFFWVDEESREKPLLIKNYTNLLIFLISGKIGLLGRDILNKHVLEFNGPDFKYKFT